VANDWKLIAQVKVGKVKGKSRVYPQLRLSSQYAELAGRKASIYEMNGPDWDTAFFIRFDSNETKDVAAYMSERSELKGALLATCPVEALSHIANSS
jgi:hypothetical protein